MWRPTGCPPRFDPTPDARRVGRRLQADAPPVPVNEWAALALGMYLKVVDRFEESRIWLGTVRTAAVDEGALPNILGHLAVLECRAGHCDLALTHAAAGREYGTRIGLRSPVATSAHVLALAHLGRTAEARALGTVDIYLKRQAKEGRAARLLALARPVQAPVDGRRPPATAPAPRRTHRPAPCRTSARQGSRPAT